MRRSLVFLAPLSLCVLATVACEDSSSGSFGTLDLDAGNLDVVTPTPTPSPSPVVDAASRIRAMIAIIFSDANGGLLETKLIGANGRATSSSATTPSIATALLKNGSNFSIVTWERRRRW